MSHTYQIKKNLVLFIFYLKIIIQEKMMFIELSGFIKNML
jgi:hypothetical protein